MTKSVFTLNDLRAAFAASGDYPTMLSAELYDRAEAEGFDMIGFIRPRLTEPPVMTKALADAFAEIERQQQIPFTGHPMPGSVTRQGTPVRKRITEGRVCHGKDVPCQPGLNGRCTACFEDD